MRQTLTGLSKARNSRGIFPLDILIEGFFMDKLAIAEGINIIN